MNCSLPSKPGVEGSNPSGRATVSSGTSIHHPAHDLDGGQAFPWRPVPPPASIIRFVVQRLDAHGGPIDGVLVTEALTRAGDGSRV
jgi:hypothetical protein